MGKEAYRAKFIDLVNCELRFDLKLLFPKLRIIFTFLEYLNNFLCTYSWEVEKYTRGYIYFDTQKAMEIGTEFPREKLTPGPVSEMKSCTSEQIDMLPDTGQGSLQLFINFNLTRTEKEI